MVLIIAIPLCAHVCVVYRSNQEIGNDGAVALQSAFDLTTGKVAQANFGVTRSLPFLTSLRAMLSSTLKNSHPCTDCSCVDSPSADCPSVDSPSVDSPGFDSPGG